MMRMPENTVIVMIIALSGFSWCRADELEDLSGAYKHECIARMKAAQKGEALDPSQEDFIALWLDRFSEAIENYPQSDAYEWVLREIAGMLVWSGRVAEAVPYHEKLIELARTPEETVHEMNQLSHTLLRAAREAKFDNDLTPGQDFDLSFAWRAISQLEAVRRYLDDTEMASRAGYQEWIAGTMQRQAEMYTLLEDYASAADMYIAAYEWFPRLTNQDREILGWGPSGQLVLESAMRAFARSGQPKQTLACMQRVLSLPERRPGVGLIWGQLLEIDCDAYFDAALAWVLGLPDPKDYPVGVIGQLTFEAKHKRQDHALAYDLLTLQLDHYPDQLSNSVLEELRKKQEYWLRDKLQYESEQIDQDPLKQPTSISRMSDESAVSEVAIAPAPIIEKPSELAGKPHAASEEQARPLVDEAKAEELDRETEQAQINAPAPPVKEYDVAAEPSRTNDAARLASAPRSVGKLYMVLVGVFVAAIVGAWLLRRAKAA